MDNIFDECTTYAAQVNSQKHKRLQRKQAVWDTATITAKLITEGKLYFAGVPKQIKDEVKEILIRRNREDLIVE